MSKEAAGLLRAALESSNPRQVAKALEQAEGEISAGITDSETLLWVGVGLAQGGRYADAKPLLEKALEADPSFFYASYWLSIIAKKMGQLAASAEYAARAVEIEPQNPGALERLGLAYLDMYRFVDAEAVFQKAIALSPKPALLGGLGLALKGQRRMGEACRAFRQLLKADPQSFITHLNLAACLIDSRDGEAAVKHAQIACRLRPDSVEAKTALASAFIADDKPDEAEKCLAEVMESTEPTGAVVAMSGRIREILGKTEESVADYRRSLELDPAEPLAFLGLVQSRRMTTDDLPFIERIESEAAAEGLSLGSRSTLHFALGKAYEDLGRYERAMQNFDPANRAARMVRFGDSPFDLKAVAEAHEAVIQVISREFLAEHRGVGIPSDLPIIVIGMMRSGTTLTEQILSCHPEIGGAGEQNYWTNNRSKAFKNGQPILDPEKLRELANGYCRLLAAKAPGFKHVVDKLPNNYAMQPLIHLALPNARFIHIRRHPVDTCLSIYTTPNAARNEWANDQSNIVFEYRQYLRFMEAWRQVIPPECTLEINYEDLVANQEEVTRRMISFCGLEWNDACLRPHEWHGIVSTPSVLQVRRPVYQTSVEKWRRYGPWLGGFRDLLTEEEAASIANTA